jgi:aspartate aminotransferase-like enzyme
MAIVYKVAEEPREFEMIHALNYRTFVEEIPQHAANGERRLVDRFHAGNTYVIALDGSELAGMVAIRGERPFSLDEKLPDLAGYLPQARRLCEIRLLALEARYRKRAVFAGLVARLLQVARERRYEVALISGTVRELKLYRHLGFEPFGPLVGRAGAQYQPMLLTAERFASCMRKLFGASDPRSFLPGPVAIAEHVREKLREPPLSHRGEAFHDLLVEVRTKLRSLTGARNVAVLLGSGTLANDVVAAQLSLAPGRGLILANGEFGERLVDHAARWGLACDVYRLPWGRAFERGALASRLARRPTWVWLVHCETSTGMLNDLAAVQRLCAPLGIEVCADAISSLGTVPCDFSALAFATGVSGKALGAYPGIALVFHRDAPAKADKRLPRYLDLALYGDERGVPFTHSSNLLAALAAALETAGPERHACLREDAFFLRAELEAAGLACVVPSQHASPAIFTLALPPSVRAAWLAGELSADGFLVAHASRYLAERNWLQIAMMGEYSRADLRCLAAALQAHAGAKRPRTAVSNA